MNSLTAGIKQQKFIGSLLIDLSALTVIYLVPTFSHLIGFPLYLIEPMRIMLILAMVHTNKTNAVIIALTLPVFSFLISGHPVLPKMMLIAAELLVNVVMFYFLTKKLNKVFPAILLSILLSKLMYYGLKFSLIQLAFLDSGLVSTPIYIQVIMTFVLSGYLYLFLRKQENN